MYESHSSLTEPEDDAVLWRYLDLAKLLSLLEDDALFFTRIPHLGDPFEGHLTRPMVEKIRTMAPDASGEEKTRKLHAAKVSLHAFQNFRKMLCVSCWHMNSVESAAMWSIYLKTGDGIAIRTNFRRFRESIRPEGPAVSAGMVKYVDYDCFEVDNTNIFNWAILKRQSFEDEREFRAIALEAGGPMTGILVPLALQTLIAEIYVAPTAPTWLTDLVRKLLKRYDLHVRVSQSTLHDHPMYYAERNKTDEDGSW